MCTVGPGGPNTDTQEFIFAFRLQYKCQSHYTHKEDDRDVSKKDTSILDKDKQWMIDKEEAGRLHELLKEHWPYNGSCSAVRVGHTVMCVLSTRKIKAC